MAENIIWLVCVSGCGILFYCIGIYAERREKPMWFWSGTMVSAKMLTDVKAYNLENGKMWKNYSFQFFAAAIVYFYNEILALVVLVIACTAGLVWLTKTYNKIRAKYEKKEVKKKRR